MPLNIELARHNMVEQQIRPWQVLDARVLEALTAVHREDFVPAAHRSLAFTDVSLPLGHAEVMMKPVVEGRLLQALAPTAADNVLEIGTGSGFITACLAHLSGSVVSVEQHADFADSARERLSANGFHNVTIEINEAVNGYHPSRQFDAIAVTGAVYSLPSRFRDWLKPNGRLFAIIGESPAMQAMLYTRVGESGWAEECLFETDIPYLSNASPPKHFVL